MSKSFFETANTGRSNQAKVQITSLMDVLTIILIFLLTNYSDEPPEQNPPKGITIPIIAAKSKNKSKKSSKYTKEIKIAFYKQKIEVVDQIIPFENFADQSDQVLSLVSEKLKTIIDPLKEEDKKNCAIILLADKDINYSMMSSLIKAASMAGVTHIELLGTFEEKE